MLKCCTIIFFVIILSFVAKTQPTAYKNIWNDAPKEIPTGVSTDAPLLGNGDLLATFGYKKDCLRFYISKNNFWRLQSKYGTPGKSEAQYSGGRIVGYLDIDFLQNGTEEKFKCEQNIWNGIATTIINNNVSVTSWICATQNLLFLELKALKHDCSIKINLSAPQNSFANLSTGKTNNVFWQTRSFVDSVDISTKVAVAMKVLKSYGNNIILLQKNNSIIIALAVTSKFQQNNPLFFAINEMKKINVESIEKHLQQHNAWWKIYWSKSSVTIDDSILMKAYYQGLYTMGACCRDKRFPPGIFGWVTTDNPAWCGDYHLNYNFEAPFYSLCSSNRLKQAEVYDGPILSFIQRGK